MRGKVAGAIVVVILFGGMALWRGQVRADKKDQLIADVQTWDGYVEHEELILEVIEREHEATSKRHYVRVNAGSNTRRFDWDGYRASMYRSIIIALTEHRHQDAALDLERFHSR